MSDQPSQGPIENVLGEETPVTVTEEPSLPVLKDVESKIQEVPSSLQKGQSPPERSSEEIKEPVLSPRSAQKSKRSQSPIIDRGKLEAARKKYSEFDEKLKTVQAKVNELGQTKKNLEIQLAARKEAAVILAGNLQVNERSAQEVSRLQLQHENLITQLQVARQNYKNNQYRHAEDLKRLQEARVSLQRQLQEKQLKEEGFKKEQLYKIKELEDKINHEELRTNQLLNHIKGLESKKTTLQGSINERTQIKQTLVQAINIEKQNFNLNKAGVEQRKADLIKRINFVKDRINSKKEERSQLKDEGVRVKGEDQQKIAIQIKKFKQQNDELRSSKKKLQEEIIKKVKISNQLRDNEKKKEKKIIDLKTRSQALFKSIKQLKEEELRLQESKQEAKKVIKYEEKVPEELIAIHSKNQGIKKEIKKVAETYEAEKNELQKLVPPVVIENLNKKIAQTIANNEKLVEITKQIEDLTKQNRELDEQKSNLQWGQNTNVRDLDAQKKRQEEKNKQNEEQLLNLRKKHQQVTHKLEEYIATYPGFNPEKKKKVEPIVEPKAKKGEEKSKKSISVSDERSDKNIKEDNKKKKNIVEVNINRANSGVEVVQESEIKKQQKAKNKKKKTISPAAGDNKVEEKQDLTTEVKPIEQPKQQSPPPKIQEPAKVGGEAINPEKKNKKRKK